MACSHHTSPCGCQDPCKSYDTNPQYDNCGCLNSVSFQCITDPGSQPNLGITNSMTGLEALAQINLKAIKPYPHLTEAQRLALTVSTESIGIHIYQTDGTEGVYVYKSTGWVLAY